MKFINDFMMDFLTIETQPFPHVIIDNFLKEEYLVEILLEIEELSTDKSYYLQINLIIMEIKFMKKINLLLKII